MSIYHSRGLVVTRHQFIIVKMIKEDMLRVKTDLTTRNHSKYIVKMYERMKSQRILVAGIVDNLFNNLVDNNLDAETKAKYEEIAKTLSERLTKMACILYTHIAPRQKEAESSSSRGQAGARMPREVRLDIEDCELEELPSNMSGLVPTQEPRATRGKATPGENAKCTNRKNPVNRVLSPTTRS
jgi:hypothetical protein